MLEHAAELEKPFAMAGVADAAADKEGTYGGFRQKAYGDIVGELGASGNTIHFSDFVGADGVDFFPEKWRKSQHVMQESGAQ